MDLHFFSCTENTSTNCTLPSVLLSIHIKIAHMMFDLFANEYMPTMIGAESSAPICPIMGISTILTFHNFTFSLMSLFAQRHLYLQLYEKLSSNLLERTMSPRAKLVGEAGLEPAIDVISRTNYVSTAYKTASLLPIEIKS